MTKHDLEILASDLYLKADEMRHRTKQEPTIFLPDRLAKEFSEKLCVYRSDDDGTKPKNQLGGYDVCARNISYPIIGVEVPFVEVWQKQITLTSITGVITP